MRLDQWLWCVRVFRTRTLAAAAIKAGHVTVNGQPAKPAKEVHPGELIAAVANDLTRTLKVIAAPKSRVAARLVPEFAEDLTPPEESTKPREPRFAPIFLRPRGTGRPTKKDRRQLDDLQS